MADRKPKRMLDTTLRAIIDNKLAAAIGSTTGDDVVKNRLDAEKYYRGDKRGDEKPGRSSVVDRTVAESIDGAMPSLLKIFFGGDQVVSFTPRNAEDEGQAKHETDYVNWIFREQNAGFVIGRAWGHDALLKRLGTAKVWWEERSTSKRESYQGLTDPEFEALSSDPKLELREDLAYPDPEAEPLPPPDVVPVSHEACRYRPAEDPARSCGACRYFNGDGTCQIVEPPIGAPMVCDYFDSGAPPPTLHDCVFERTVDASQVKVAAIPPDEVLIDRRAGADELPFGHRTLKTVSDLCEQYPEKAEIIRSLPTDEDDLNQERTERFADEGALSRDASAGVLDPSTREVWCSELYLRVDYDGDGRAELRRIVTVGASSGLTGEILENEPCDDDPFACLPCLPIPHKLIGQSLFDKVRDVQDVKTALTRKMLDNIYLVNESELFITGDVDEAAATDRKPGNIIRGKNGATCMPIPVPPILEQSLQALAYFDSVREGRIGMRRMAPGPAADALRDDARASTLGGQEMQQDATRERIEEIARIWAETGYKTLFRKIHALVLKHQQEPRAVKLRGKWVDIDPRDWATREHLTVSCGIGTGDKEERLTGLGLIAAKQEQIIANAGPNNPLASVKHYYHTLAEMAEAAGFTSPDPFFNDPGDQPFPEPQPDGAGAAPDVVGAEKVKAEADLTKQARQIESNERIKNSELKLQRELGYAKIAVDSGKVEVDAILRAVQHDTEVHFRTQDHERNVANDEAAANDREAGRAFERERADREHKRSERDFRVANPDFEPPPEPEPQEPAPPPRKLAGVVLMHGPDGRVAGARKHYDDGSADEIPISRE